MGSRQFSPNEILDFFEVERPEEIDLKAFANYCGLLVIEKPLEGFEGSIIGAAKQGVITVNSLSSEGRKRFSIAHEMGHWHWDRGKCRHNCTQKTMVSSWSLADPECRANQYAVELLMPKHLLLPKLKGEQHTLRLAQNIAKEFRTSLTSSAIRIVEMGAYPCSVLYSEGGRVKWCSHGPDVPKWLRYRGVNHSSTLAHDILKNSEAGELKSETMDLDSWFESDGCEGYEIYESSISLGADRVLTLLWWKDESFIEENA